MSDSTEWDISLIVGSVVVFILPLTTLIPGFSVWNVVPKIRVFRYHILSGDVTWLQLNLMILTILVILFCLYLEIRKRKLDDMVEKVLTVGQATDVVMGVERDRQTAAVKACVHLLDTSTQHYEHLVLLRDDLRKRDKMRGQHAPAIELTSSEFN